MRTARELAFQYENFQNAHLYCLLNPNRALRTAKEDTLNLEIDRELNR